MKFFFSIFKAASFLVQGSTKLAGMSYVSAHHASMQIPNIIKNIRVLDLYTHSELNIKKIKNIKM